jgi:hypothetical protein
MNKKEQSKLIQEHMMKSIERSREEFMKIPHHQSNDGGSLLVVLFLLALGGVVIGGVFVLGFIIGKM